MRFNFKFNHSDREFHDPHILIGLYKVIDEVCIQHGLHNARQEGGVHHILPVEYPKSRMPYQWKI